MVLKADMATTPLEVSVLWVDVVIPVLTDNWDLLVEGLLEQRPVFGEGCNTCASGNTPDGKDWSVSNDVLDVETTDGGCVFEKRT